MGTIVSETKLKPHLPELFKRLNTSQLFNSLLPSFGDFDQGILRKKLATTDNDATINFDIYLTLKRALGSRHVACFLQAVQEQFDDLSHFGINFMAPRNGREAVQLPVPGQPRPVQGSDPRMRQLPDTTRVVRDLPTHGQINASWEDSAPSTQRQIPGPPIYYGQSNTRQVVSDPPIHRQFDPTRVITGSHSLNPGFSSSSLPSGNDHYYTLPCAEWVAKTRRPLGPRVPQSTAPFQPRAPCADTVRTTPDPSHGQSSVTMQDVLDNIEGKNCIRPPGNLHPNILTSVEDNGDTEGACAVVDNRGGEPPTRVVLGQDLPHPSPDQKVNNLTHLSQDRSSYANVQTDGDLSEEDVHPEQPETMMATNDNDQGSDNDLQHPSPLRDTTEFQPVIKHYTIIKKIVVLGEGNHVDFGGHKFAKTSIRSSRRPQQPTSQDVRDGEGTSLPPIAFPPGSADLFPQATSNAGPQCPAWQYPEQNTATYCQNDLGLMDLSERSNTSELRGIYISDQTLGPQNPAQSAQFTENVETITARQSATNLPENSHYRHTDVKNGFHDQESSVQFTELPILSALSSFCSSEYHHNTQPKVEWQNQAETIDTKLHCVERKDTTQSEQIQDKDPKAARKKERPQEQRSSMTREVTVPKKFSDVNNEVTSPKQLVHGQRDVTNPWELSHAHNKLRDAQNGISSPPKLNTAQSEVTSSRELSDPQNEETSLKEFDHDEAARLLTAPLCRPAALLGPEELRFVEEQRNASIEILLHSITLSTEAS